MPDIDPEDLGPVLREALARKLQAIYGEVRKAFTRDALRWQSAVTGRLRGGLVLGAGKGANEALARRTGNLARSLGYEVTGDSLDDLESRKFSTSPYAPVQEEGTIGAGGTRPDIVPVRRQWLAIPTRAAMTASGVPRRPGPLSYPDLRFVKSKRRDDVAWLVPQGMPLSEALYILRKKVAIPPRLGMRDTHEQQQAARAKDILEAVRKGLAA